MAHENFPRSDRSWQKFFPSPSYFLSDFQAGTLTGEWESVNCAGFCVKYLLLDWMCSVSSEQRGSHWKICNRLKAGLGAPDSPALNGFCCFSVWIRSFWLTSHLFYMNSTAFLSPTGLWLLKIPLAYLQICRNSTVRVSLAMKTTIIHLLYSFYLPDWYLLAHVFLLLARDVAWMQKIPGPAFVW